MEKTGRLVLPWTPMGSQVAARPEEPCFDCGGDGYDCETCGETGFLFVVEEQS